MQDLKKNNEETEIKNEESKVEVKEEKSNVVEEIKNEIKEETVNGDKATVETEIEVTDYTRALKQAESYRTTNESEFLDDNDEFDEARFNNYKLDLIKESDERVKYTIYFSLTKENDEWVLDDLTETEEEKILGIYEY